MIESTHRHDWRQCACGHVFVDGGKEYIRHGYLDPERVQSLCEFTEGELPAELNKSGDEWTTSEVGL